MLSDIIIPDDAVKYILFQRTAYLALWRTRFVKILKKLSPWSLYNAVVILESMLQREKVKQLFNEDMMGEYESIKSWLPNKCSRILDIGCGVGGIDVLLHRHYNCDGNTEFYLLDKTGINRKVYYGFKKEPAFYNSLDMTEQLLSQNGIHRENIHLLEVTSEHHINVPVVVDLVISLSSWGFHYPVSTYVNEVCDILRQEGHLILDVRKGKREEEELEQKFAKVQIISEGEKHFRVFAVK